MKDQDENKDKGLSVNEKLMYTTTRIETVDSSGKRYSGTGFFYGIQSKTNPSNLSVWVLTNKHVIDGMKSISICLSQAGDDGKPLLKEPLKCVIENVNFIIRHPGPDVDLCAIPASLFVNSLIQAGHNPFYQLFSSKIIPSAEEMKELDSIEQITMIGYPEGLWDAKHNLPLVRNGITSTPVYVDHNGKEEFLIDAACYHGSSGSPVILLNNGSYTNKYGDTFFGANRVYLLGILSQGPLETIYGEIEIKDQPEIKSPIRAKVKIPTNLGLVIKSSRILELEEVIRKTIPVLDK